MFLFYSHVSFQDYLAERGLKFVKVSVRFCSVSNIFNFEIRQMTAAEKRAHSAFKVIPASADDPSQKLDASTDDSGHSLDVSDLPVSDGRSPDDSQEGPGNDSGLDHGPVHNLSAPDSGLNSSSGTLIFIIRVLLVFNFFLSVSFLVYLL